MKRPGRNDLCWCGSGKKYKKCHIGFDDRIEEIELQGHIVPDHSIIKNAEQIEKIKERRREYPAKPFLSAYAATSVLQP